MKIMVYLDNSLLKSPYEKPENELKDYLKSFYLYCFNGINVNYPSGKNVFSGIFTGFDSDTGEKLGAKVLGSVIANYFVIFQEDNYSKFDFDNLENNKDITKIGIEL